jgi:hypothetical protein
VRLQEVEWTRIMDAMVEKLSCDSLRSTPYKFYTQILMVSHRGNVHGITERHMKQSSLPTTVLICSAGICCVCPFFNSFILPGISIDGSSRDRRSWSIAQKPPRLAGQAKKEAVFKYYQKPVQVRGSAGT